MPKTIGGISTFGQALQRLGPGVQFWQLNRVLAADPTLYSKVGNLRVIEDKDFPRLEDSMRRAGYLPALSAL